MIAESPDAPYAVAKLEVGGSGKALDGALKEYKSSSPATAAMLFSVDADAGKVLCMAQVPKVSSARDLLCTSDKISICPPATKLKRPTCTASKSPPPLI